MTAAAAAGVLAAALLSAAPAAADDYPSWDQIAAAKSDLSAREAQISELEEHLAKLQDEAGALGNAAVDASSRYDALRGEVLASDARVAELAEERAAAAAEASELRSQVGALAAQTYKTGGMDSTVLFLLDSEEGVAHLDRMTTLQLVTERTSRLFGRADAAEKSAAALEDAEAAEREARKVLAEEADALYKDAEAATTAADKAVRTQEERTAVLIAQLADLRETTAEAELARMQAARAEESVRQQAEAAEKAAAETGRPEAGPVINPTRPSSPPASAAPSPSTPPATPTPPVAAPAPPAAPPAPPVQETVPPAPAAPVDDPAGAQNYALSSMPGYGWDGGQFRCLVNLWNRESNWRTSAANPYSGAYGIPQSLPGNKMAAFGEDWRTNYRTQINWGLFYIQQRYGSPCAAWAHSEKNNWY
ncbi:lytic transglycosylase domain-containing protein [Arthrobacter sp. Sa2CUA1]|uniref:Lytic transglycosylase domain-containing protein n=1 Tax=Arthrobacter gallicola TaxID=2762225 RepID=A0ABR8UU29_9MICC|nr:lytic transglycosylase domain-containing protein [Arthrobacter gallicola]MBD7995895.1 lytic transglycosylase domain-containing protein [Arthrobacter gallicola]